MEKDETLQDLTDTTKRLLAVLTGESARGMMGWKMVLGDVMTQLARLMPPEIVQKVADERAERAESGLPKDLDSAISLAEQMSNDIARAALIGDKEKVGAALKHLDHNLDAIKKETRRRLRV